MSDFSNILKRGRKIFEIKDGGGVWERCEECGERLLCFPYKDVEDETWLLCEECTTIFVKECE